MKSAEFEVNNEKCTGCGLCLDVCPGNMVGGSVLKLEDGKPVMVNQTKFGWRGCWSCQHCMAICPTEAISILGVKPEDVTGKPAPETADELAKLMAYRRSCRDFKKDDVDKETIDKIMDAVSAVPTGGNNQSLEFSVVYTRDAMKKIYQAVCGKPGDDFSDLRIYDAPHLFIAHKPIGGRFSDGGMTEINLATGYFELMANASGLGTIISTYAAEQLSKNKEALEILGIPKNHKFTTVVGFGYPKYNYARGIKKERPVKKVF